MTPIVRSLLLKRYRSVVAGEVEFDNPTFLVGRNGSGKSNIIDALAFLGDCASVSLAAALRVRGGIRAVQNATPAPGGAPRLGLAVELARVEGRFEEARYAFELRARPDGEVEVAREQGRVVLPGGARVWFDRDGDRIRSNLGSALPPATPTFVALQLLPGDARFFPVADTLARVRLYSIQPEAMRPDRVPESGDALERDGSNAASVLREIRRRSPDDFQRISEFLAALLPSGVEVRPVERGEKLSLELAQTWEGAEPLRLGPPGVSDGTLRALGLLLAAYQKRPPTVLAIEEPEATMHPAGVAVILDVIDFASRRSQVVATTHSTEALDAKWVEDRHLRVVEWEAGATRVGRIGVGARRALAEHLMGAGELLRSNVLDTEGIFPSGNGCAPVQLFEDLA